MILAHQFHESGQLREIWGDDPPAHLPRALALHHSAILLTRDRDREERAKKSRGGHQPNPLKPDGGSRP